MCECVDHIAKGDKMSEKVEIVYKGAVPSGLKVMTDGETVWLTQEQMCLLFGRERSVITKHINNVFNEGELPKRGFVQICTKPQKSAAVRLLCTILTLSFPSAIA